MKYQYLTLNWVFGILFLLTGLISSVEAPLAGLCLIAAAALLLPPVRNFVYSKTNQEFLVKDKAVYLFILFVAFVFFAGQALERRKQELAAQQAQEKAEKAAQLRQENIDHFNANREQIVSAVKRALSENDYQSVIFQSDKYLVAGDKELEQLNAQAKDELASIKKAKETEKLLAELKGVPPQEYQRRRSLYWQLTTLHPDNELYETKVESYTKKLEEEKRKEKRNKRINSQFSAWDGSHRNLEKVVKHYMNDPDSYDHVETVYWDRGDHLVIRTTFRGKNAFGGVVIDSLKAKVSLDGQVLQLIDQY